jgi:hypothetical protein
VGVAEVQARYLYSLDIKRLNANIDIVNDERREWAARNNERYSSTISKTKMRLPTGLLRAAVTTHIDKIDLNGLRYWTQILEDVRLEIAAEAKRILAARKKPRIDEAVMLYRLRKCMNSYIYRRVDRLRIR